MSSRAAWFAAQAWDQMAWALSQSCSASLGVAGVIGLDSGLEQLAVLGGQVGGGFPDQVGDLPPRADSRCSVAASTSAPRARP